MKVYGGWVVELKGKASFTRRVLVGGQISWEFADRAGRTLMWDPNGSPGKVVVDEMELFELETELRKMENAPSEEIQDRQLRLEVERLRRQYKKKNGTFSELRPFNGKLEWMNVTLTEGSYLDLSKPVPSFVLGYK